jgi:hypothetical protein
VTEERRYAEDEVGEIFEIAARTRDAGGRAVPAAGGLTLGELQAIGREVGLPPERIAEAASALDLRRSALPRGTFLGMPISVGRTIELPRAPTDREWEMLVSELRQVFRAQGKARSSGNLREWTNGNLHANIEPTEGGYRLRMGTLKGEAVAINRAGAAILLLGLVMLAVLAITGQLAEDVAIPLIFGGMAAAGFAWNAVRLPGWALEREQQMDQITARARELLAQPPEASAD